ncbi:Very short patch repair protein [Microbacterium oxydans]|uniref:Very short patch repair protein n=1 Tax=Microbacterium oxydans TaxID=82380 RepID=A0A3Q9J6H8_9MICO|nr:Very short patch repair protein [Microbacterium oxydans]
MFTKLRIAVFIDGCFWHGCPQHATLPKRNADYWVPKLRQNVQRDRETTTLLHEAGWTVLRFWEHEDADAVAQAIVDVVNTDSIDPWLPAADASDR